MNFAKKVQNTNKKDQGHVSDQKTELIPYKKYCFECA